LFEVHVDGVAESSRGEERIDPPGSKEAMVEVKDGIETVETAHF